MTAAMNNHVGDLEDYDRRITNMIEELSNGEVDKFKSKLYELLRTVLSLVTPSQGKGLSILSILKVAAGKAMEFSNIVTKASLKGEKTKMMFHVEEINICCGEIERIHTNIKEIFNRICTLHKSLNEQNGSQCQTFSIKRSLSKILKLLPMSMTRSRHQFDILKTSERADLEKLAYELQNHGEKVMVMFHSAMTHVAQIGEIVENVKKHSFWMRHPRLAKAFKYFGLILEFIGLMATPILLYLGVSPRIIFPITAAAQLISGGIKAIEYTSNPGEYEEMERCLTEQNVRMKTLKEEIDKLLQNIGACDD